MKNKTEKFELSPVLVGNKISNEYLCSPFKRNKMAVTRLMRKAKRNKLVAKKREAIIKISRKPTLKNPHKTTEE